jgi:hypothetical protein
VIIAASSCQNGNIEHVGTARLVILEPVTMADKKFDENFRAAMELLYPFQCHDSVYIQDRIFLERIDLETPYRREFMIPPSLVRDFFGSNNPAKKQSLREDLFFLSDTSFEIRPDTQFLLPTHAEPGMYPRMIGEYLTRNRKSALVYFFSFDTLIRNFPAGGTFRDVYHDIAKLNCRIVSDLRVLPVSDLPGTSVIILIIPQNTTDTAATDYPQGSRNNSSAKQRREGFSGSKGCQADTAILRINRERTAIITEFRNLLHYIATTTLDDELKRKYRYAAWAKIGQIPGAVTEGIPGNDLGMFLNSGFSRNVKVYPVFDHCRMIKGVHIELR